MLSNLLLKGEATDDPNVMIVYDSKAGTCLGRVWGIFLSHDYSHLGLITPSPYMSFHHVKNFKIERDKEGEDKDCLNIEMGDT